MKICQMKQTVIFLRNNFDIDIISIYEKVALNNNVYSRYNNTRFADNIIMYNNSVVKLEYIIHNGGELIYALCREMKIYEEKIFSDSLFFRSVLLTRFILLNFNDLKKLN